MNAFRLVPAACLLTVGLTAWAAPSLSTDEARYDAEDPVIFTLENDSPNVLGWGSFGRHPVVFRVLASGKRETVYALPEILDEGAVMLPPGEEAQWVWYQTQREDGDAEPGGGDGDGDIVVRVEDPDAEPGPQPMRGDGSHVGRGVYVAEFGAFDEVYTSDEFRIRDTLAVDPAGKAAVTWGSLKARR